MKNAILFICCTNKFNEVFVLVSQKKFDVQFKEAECYKIDTENKKVHCRSTAENHLGGSEDFTVDYDYLVIAMGARVNTFNTPGVVEHAHFLKVTEKNSFLNDDIEQNTI